MVENFTITPIQQYVPTVQYVETTHHAISFGEIAIVVAGLIFLVYWLIKASNNREYYEHWKNPSGREINLYKRIRIMLYLYTAVVVILGLLQIYLTNMRMG